jgi:hypothetical protein
MTVTYRATHLQRTILKSNIPSTGKLSWSMPPPRSTFVYVSCATLARFVDLFFGDGVRIATVLLLFPAI